MQSEEFKRIWLPLSDQFYRAAYYILESEADARDAVQDLYVKLWNSKDKLDTVLRPATYGISILKNLCLDRIRHAKVAETEDMKAAERVEDSGPPPDRNLIDRESINRLNGFIEKLPDKQRKVLKLKIFKGLEYDEISKLTGLSEVNLRVLLSTARKTLREKMEYEKY